MNEAPELRGTWFVLPTPFGEDGSLDLASQRRVVESAVAWGVDGLTAMGVTSEAPSLTPDERQAALEVILRTAADVPVAVGCSAGSAEAAASLARQAGTLGACAAMVSAPPLARNVDALSAFFARVAVEGALPLVVQDEPAATGVTLPLSVLVRCVRESGARAVKLEDPPTPPKIASLLAANPGLRVFGGLGGVSALYELARGASGTMTGFAFPEILTAVRAAVEGGDRRRAAEVFDRYLPLLQFEAQPVAGLAVRKELLRRRGAIASSLTRGAVRSLDAATAAELEWVLARVGIEPASDRLEVKG